MSLFQHSKSLRSLPSDYASGLAVLERSSHRGYLLVLVLVFGAVFFTILTAFTGYVITQGDTQESKYNKERALDIAEAGLNYYKWFLAHYPNDTTNGTGEAGPYVIPYEDPEGSVIGEYSLDIESSATCGDIDAIDIYSTGRTVEDPDAERTIYARYARPTVSEYAYILNSNVWAGPDRTIIGPYHSNGVIRMDGTNLSTVSSGQESWRCDEDLFPCDPDDDGDRVDAVYGDGPNDELWSFPSTPINFTGLSVDLVEMQEKAEAYGVYIPYSGEYGYRIRFEPDGTIDVYEVDRTYSYSGYTTEYGWQNERHAIDDDDFEATYTIPATCPVIFVEDKVWLEGVVKGKVTIAAADVDTANRDHSIILNGNITYADDESGLLAIAEGDMLIGVAVPNTMTVNGIFMAQKGRFGRNHYDSSLPRDLDDYRYRSTLNVNGTIVSNGREGTKWMNGDTYVSGFNTRNNSYDRDLVADPPPLTPETSDTYEFIEWREMD